MSDETLSLEQVISELSMTEGQIRAAVQAGKLRQITGEDPPRFLRQDVDNFKKQLQTDATVSFEPSGEDTSHLDLGAAAGKEEEGDPNEITEFAMEVDSEEAGSSRIDLAEVEAEPGADESDQTSVLPIGEEVGGEDESGEPVFDFAEEDLGLADDESSDAAVTSEDSAAIALGSDQEEPSDFGIEAADAESSADILEIAEEINDESSSDAMVAVQDESDSENATLSDSAVVTDILEGDEEDSDDELDTIDLDEMDAPGSETALEEGDDLMTVIEDETEGSAVETAPLSAGADEAETVGLAEGDVETESVAADEGAAEATVRLEDEGAAGAYAEPAGRVVPRTAAYQPSAWCNGLLIASILLVAFGGFVMLCEASGATANPVIEFVRDFINQNFPNL